ncbi:hypothetical protein F0365_12285 [Nonlabens sp. Ci31]|jgi:hypothetical protein|uniref:hypothetical protein n=1 Tax=Nonlabens sp. Ci31 TaxID=2608253 RepID=UPI0014640FF7|nr:hypothetical protein [Nonlabens sp. Ci31]QJP35109.1 hypothetical protein F0365_12285 [Nonlabens sp. Ci31]
MKSFLCFSILILSLNAYSQNGFESWDKNYKLVDIRELINAEFEYAKKVEADTAEAQYYVAMNTFRFIAEFTGEQRKVSDETIGSSKNVFKLKTGNSDILNDLVHVEYKFIVIDIPLWISIQKQLENPFKEEVKVGGEVLLYTLFTNEHTYKGQIINTFIISEFTTTWK